jgi:S-disulfanyl-L-cysteine oxidoreductase SoxD
MPAALHWPLMNKPSQPSRMTGRCFAAACLGSISLLMAQAPATVATGVYTAQQATAGEAAYKADCASCHGDSLEGKGRNTPPVKGTDFLNSWRTGNLGELYEKVRGSMPADRPGQLGAERNAAIIAYLLRENGFPAGSTPLVGDAKVLDKVAWK